MGWIPNTTPIFQSKKNTGDYHDEMTGEHFEEWFKDKLLQNIPPNSLIAMDNASYYSRIDQRKVGPSPKCMSGLCIMVYHLILMTLSHNSSQSYKTLFNHTRRNHTRLSTL